MSAVPVVFGFRPSSHGFGWIAFSSPFSVHDWGVVDAKGDKNEQCLVRLENLLRRLAVHTFVLEAFENTDAKVSQRVVRLCRAVVALAQANGLEVQIFSRGQVKACFASVGARTRHEVAAAIARSFAMLRHLLPEKRQPWQPPHRRMALFDAAAVVLTHYQLGAASLFEELQKKAESISEMEED